MKKFLWFLLVLIILGGVGLYFGWAQAKVPPGSYGILRSKTHGTEPLIIKDGEFRWIWYKLIPTNVQILVFTPRNMKRSLSISGNLPSGRQYAVLAGIDEDFSWMISGEFSFSIKPESLPSLVEKQNLADEAAFKALEDNYAENIDAYIKQSLRALGDEDSKMEALLASFAMPDLNTEIERAFPDIEGFSSIIKSVSSPDFDLYRSVKALNEDYLNRMSVVLQDDLIREAETRINQRIRLDELTQYGELLTKYPILLQYLALEKGIVPQ